MDSLAITGRRSHLRDEVTLAFGKELDRAYAAFVKTAAREWARHFSAGEASDACVSVRISDGNGRQLGGQHYLAA